jgi:hypothetical protein
MFRIITTRVRTSSLQVTSCIASLLALELLQPAPSLYLIAPLFCNTPLLPMQLDQFSSLSQSDETATLSLAEILIQLAERGVAIHLIYGAGSPICDEFLAKLPESIHQRSTNILSCLGLFSDHFCLRGSMNFTDSGVSINSDRVELSLDENVIAQALVEVQDVWRELQ